MWIWSKFQRFSVFFWVYLRVVKWIFKFPTKTWLVLVAERDVAQVRQVAGSVSHDSSWWLRDCHELYTERWKFPAETCCDPVKKELGQWVNLVTERLAVNLLKGRLCSYFILFFRILLYENKILWVAPLDQQSQLQRFPQDTFTKQSQEIGKQVKKAILYFFVQNIPHY